VNETNENTVTFTIRTSNTQKGDTLDLNFLGGIDGGDVKGDLPSTTTVEADGTATVELTFSSDEITESTETLTLIAAIGSASSSSDQIRVADTSNSNLPITVFNTNDSGSGSLRSAIEKANDTKGKDTIKFVEGLSGTTITLTGGDLPI